MKRLEHDEWDRPIVYSAKYQGIISGGLCLFSNLDAAIFYVVTGLGNDVDWRTFPNPGDYPYEERNGNEAQQLSPVFRVSRRGIAWNGELSDKQVLGEVYRQAAMDEWIVGNGIAEASEKWMNHAVARSVVQLSGEGDKLQGRVG